MNYFKVLCFSWAFVAIISRILMIGFGDKWKTWELSKAYSVKKPKWIDYIGVFSIILIIYTWYRVFTDNIVYSWIIALMISLSFIKVIKLTFKYDEFRAFVDKVLNKSKKLLVLNLNVIIISLILILMGIYLY
ncbi:MAG: hypothetical protein L3J74_05755 [Bacteroidales bacterium]|nr:hypothetical protein [Bacteroidales bacterium]